MMISLMLQVMLGAGHIVTRFGLPQIGYVAVSGSLSQTVTCSMHTVFGMFLLVQFCCRCHIAGSSVTKRDVWLVCRLNCPRWVIGGQSHEYDCTGC